MNDSLYRGPVDQDKNKEEPLVEGSTVSKWIGPGITLLIALLAFISGYGALKKQIDSLPEIYVTRVEWLDGFINWWPFRTSTEAKLLRIEADLRLLKPGTPRYSQIDADRYQEKRERIVDGKIKDIEDQIHTIFKRLNECERERVSKARQ